MNVNWKKFAIIYVLTLILVFGALVVFTKTASKNIAVVQEQIQYENGTQSEIE